MLYLISESGNHVIKIASFDWSVQLLICFVYNSIVNTYINKMIFLLKNYLIYFVVNYQLQQ